MAADNQLVISQKQIYENYYKQIGQCKGCGRFHFSRGDACIFCGHTQIQGLYKKAGMMTYTSWICKAVICLCMFRIFQYYRFPNVLISLLAIFMILSLSIIQWQCREWLTLRNFKKLLKPGQVRYDYNGVIEELRKRLDNCLYGAGKNIADLKDELKEDLLDIYETARSLSYLSDNHTLAALRMRCLMALPLRHDGDYDIEDICKQLWQKLTDDNIKELSFLGLSKEGIRRFLVDAACVNPELIGAEALKLVRKLYSPKEVANAEAGNNGFEIIFACGVYQPEICRDNQNYIEIIYDYLTELQKEVYHYSIAR